MNIDALQRLLRYAAWFAIAVAVIVSVVPAGARPHTSFPGTIEHFLAYLFLAALFTAGYRGRLSAGVVAVLLTFAAINLEFVQYFVPGRQPGVLDAAMGAAGAVTGAFLAQFGLRALFR